ncbi:MAG TPA: hypothetical protein VJ962_10045 [Clostridia bacterium]|nr:hypothetical protein [Clostridia bacterium]
MSAHLGNIHYWLYNQIQIIDDRNSFLIKNFNELSNKYSDSLAGVEISEALGDQHIHPGLEGLIIKVQTKEVNIVSNLLDLVSFDELKELYFQHGVKTAKSNKKSGDTVEEIIQALKDIFLERMPCDRLTQMEINENTGRIIREAKLHTEFWINSEVPVEKMHQLYQAWIQGALFVINPTVEYAREVNVDHYIDLIKVS